VFRVAAVVSDTVRGCQDPLLRGGLSAASGCASEAFQTIFVARTISFSFAMLLPRFLGTSVSYILPFPQPYVSLAHLTPRPPDALCMSTAG